MSKNYSIATADRTTQLKIVGVSLIAGIVVVVGGMAARSDRTGARSLRLALRSSTRASL